MPWASSDAIDHTKKANTPHLQELWAEVANKTLERTGNDKTAIREANAVVSRKQSRFI